MNIKIIINEYTFYIEVITYITPREGNCSPVASDPCEYYGQEEEIYWECENIYVDDEDGNVYKLNEEEMNDAVWEYEEKIERKLLDVIRNFSYEYY